VAGEGGSGGIGGASGGGGEGGQDAGDAGDADDADDGDVSVDASDGGDADVSVDADDSGDGDAAIEADAPEADVLQEADAPIEVGPEASDCPSTVENCTNGIDDNCNGLVDCADPQCSPLYRCVPPVPSGWEGYYQLYDNDLGGPTPGCAAPFSSLGATGWRTLNWQAATCSSCQCGGPTNVDCEEPLLYLVVDSTCNGTAWHLSDPTGVCGTEPCWGVDPHGACRGVNLNPGSPPEYTSAVYFEVGQPIPGTGSCAASGGNPTKPTPTWQRFGISCQADPAATAGGGCTGTNSCVPRSTASTGYEPGTCVYQPGNISTCPVPFSKRFVYYLDWLDSRSCTSCQCGTPNVTNCNGEMTVALDNTCATSGATAEAFMSSASGQPNCEPITGATTHYIKYNDLDANGQCSPSGGTPTGDVVGQQTTAMTFCCLLF